MSRSLTRVIATAHHIGARRGFANMPGRLDNPALFICDIQEKFRNAIYEFPCVISTAQKMVKAANVLNIPIYVTTQNSARLGSTVPELSSLFQHNPNTLQVDKTAFSMLVPEIATAITTQAGSRSAPSGNGTFSAGGSGPLNVLIVGIETHICVTQTALDLRAMGHKVYILADGVSSCNEGERKIALSRLRAEGCIITSSESALFEMVGDAGEGSFKAISTLVKETKEETKRAVETFCNAL